MFGIKSIYCFSLLVFALVSCSHNKRDVFMNVAKEYTKKCPVKIANNILCDSMKYDAARNVNTYYYVLSGPLDNSAAVAPNKSQVEGALIQELRNSVDLKPYKDFNTTMQYIYYSNSSHKEIFRVNIPSRLYK